MFRQHAIFGYFLLYFKGTRDRRRGVVVYNDRYVFVTKFQFENFFTRKFLINFMLQGLLVIFIWIYLNIRHCTRTYHTYILYYPTSYTHFFIQLTYSLLPYLLTYYMAIIMSFARFEFIFFGRGSI